MTCIGAVFARQILDSRGRPTVEVDVTLDDGTLGRASVPSGVSTGTYEAHERRDGDPDQYAGLGVRAAVRAVHEEVSPALRGHDVADQGSIDTLLRDLDGTDNLSRLGANAVLGTSLAVCRASALAARQPLYRRIAELAGGVHPGELGDPAVERAAGGVR